MNEPDNNTARPATSAHKAFSVWKVLLPVVIGVGVVVFMFIHDARKENLAQVWSGIHFDFRTVSCILLAFLFMFGRDFGLTWRFRALTNRELRWGQAYRVDMLCEFTSCVTPSAVGGSSLGMVFLNTEGIEFGRATTLMMTTLFLDELFFVVSCPIVVLLTPDDAIFSGGDAFFHGLRITFWVVYAFLCVWTFILFCGIIWRPLWIKNLLGKIAGWKILRKWSGRILTLGDNMVSTSEELAGKPFGFWLEVFGGTALSWTSRYLVVNALFLGFVTTNPFGQWIVLARQLVIWVVLMVSPTPGGSGLSEWLFSEYYGDMVPTAGLALILAVFWRIISYYLYLLVGAVIVPSWLRETIDRIRK